MRIGVGLHIALKIVQNFDKFHNPTALVYGENGTGMKGSAGGDGTLVALLYSRSLLEFYEISEK